MVKLESDVCLKFSKCCTCMKADDQLLLCVCHGVYSLTCTLIPSLLSCNILLVSLVRLFFYDCLICHQSDECQSDELSV